MVDLEMVPVGKLVPNARNARTHDKKQIRQVARSMERFGFTNPVLIDERYNVVAGHARLAAAQLLAMETIPCRKLSSMSDADRRAYAIADNALGLKSRWDMEILSEELTTLHAENYEIDLTGFEIGEIDKLLIEAEASDTRKADPADDAEVEPAGWPVTRLGDLWLLGRHRLLCGDAKDPLNVRQVMDGERARLAFLDPPYNVKIRGHVSGNGKKKHGEFAEASGEMTRQQFTEFLRVVFENIESACVNGAIVFICMDWRHMREMLEAGHAVFTELKNLCIWVKTNGGMGTFYRSQHELVFVWKVGDDDHINTFGLGETGRSRTNVWRLAGVNSFREGRAEDLADHPTVKPVALVAEAIRDVSKRGEIVLDTFGGSGTTLIAAQRVGRLARLVEIDPVYCDVTIRRWEKMTGKTAILAATGRSFEETGDERRAAPSVCGVAR